MLSSDKIATIIWRNVFQNLLSSSDWKVGKNPARRIDGSLKRNYLPARNRLPVVSSRFYIFNVMSRWLSEMTLIVGAGISLFKAHYRARMFATNALTVLPSDLTQRCWTMYVCMCDTLICTRSCTCVCHHDDVRSRNLSTQFRSAMKRTPSLSQSDTNFLIECYKSESIKN